MSQSAAPNHIGIDISKDYFDVALTLDSQPYQGRFENNRSGFRTFRKWLKKRGVKEASICMEATGRYGEELAQFLYQQGYQVSLVNPKRIRAYRESQLLRNKTDEIDARVIEDFCRTQKVRLWQPPAPEVVALRDMERRLDTLKEMRTMEHNRLQAGQLTTLVAETIREHIAFIDVEIAQLEEAMQKHIDGHPGLKKDAQVLTSIQGIGLKTAAVLMGEVKDIHRFEKAKELSAYLGVSPYVVRSGTSVRSRGGISKVGNARLRKALYFPTLTAMRHNPVIKAFSERLLAKGKPKKVVILASMRKLIHIIFGVWKSGQPFDPLYEQSRRQTLT